MVSQTHLGLKMKIFTLKEIEILLKKNKSKKKIGLCHGVFDILHEGHIEHFQESKKFCDILVVHRYFK